MSCTNMHQKVFYINFRIFKMFAGFTETFLKNGGQPLFYQYIKKEIEIIQITIEVLAYEILDITFIQKLL